MSNERIEAEKVKKTFELKESLIKERVNAMHEGVNRAISGELPVEEEKKSVEHLVTPQSRAAIHTHASDSVVPVINVA